MKASAITASVRHFLTLVYILNVISARQPKEKPTRSENVYIGCNYSIPCDRKLTSDLSNVTCRCRYANITSLKANANSST